jgi:hypothetical protein
MDATCNHLSIAPAGPTAAPSLQSRLIAAGACAPNMVSMLLATEVSTGSLITRYGSGAVRFCLVHFFQNTDHTFDQIPAQNVVEVLTLGSD